MSEWSDLPADVRGEQMAIKIIGRSGRVWNLAGLDFGVQGAWIAGPIEGLVHVPFESVWTKPAYGPPRFERTVDAGREIKFPLALGSDTSLGWYDVEAKFWNDVDKDGGAFLTVTTQRYGEMWVPIQLKEAPQDPLDDDPTMNNNNFQIWNVTLAVDGNPRWRQPDIFPRPFVSKVANEHKGIIRVVNRGTEPAWPVFICSAPGKIFLPDGPNAIIGPDNPLADQPSLAELFGFPEWDPNGIRRRRDANMIEVPTLLPGEHVLIDTDPSHRIAISALDPTDNIIKQFLRNSELLAWLTDNYGDSGLPVLQRFKGQGFSIPIPPRSIATLPVKHSVTNGKIWCRVPQRFERAISA